MPARLSSQIPSPPWCGIRVGRRKKLRAIVPEQWWMYISVVSNQTSSIGLQQIIITPVLDSGSKLTCGHLCPLKCHNFTDHSKVKCMELQSSECTNRHPQIWPCSAGSPKTCRKCKHIAKLARKKQQKSLADKLRRNAEQKAHLERIDAIDKGVEPACTSSGEVASWLGR